MPKNLLCSEHVAIEAILKTNTIRKKKKKESH